MIRQTEPRAATTRAVLLSALALSMLTTAVYGTSALSPEPPATVSATLWPQTTAAGPVIGTITVQTPGSIEKYAKFEVSFSITNTTASNVYFPYDPAAPPGVAKGTGITVGALFLPPGESDWGNARALPCFYYQPMEERGSGSDAALLPKGKPDWRCRFTPERIGEWQYKLYATDANGTTQTGVRQFTCIDSSRKGFIRVSTTDPRYFEFSDGTPFTTPLVNVEDGSPFNGLARLRASLAKFGENGVRFVRWFPTGEGANFFVIPFGDDIRSSWGFGTASLRADGVDTQAGKLFSFRPYYYTSESIPAVPGGKYRLRFRAQVTGDKVFRPQITYGTTPLGELTIRANGGWISYTLQVTNTVNADVLSVYLRDGYSESDQTQGTIRLHSIILQRDETGNGDWGPNLLVRSDPDAYNYVDQRNAALMDEILRLSEQYGVYHKLTLFHKNDPVLNSFLPDGTITTTWDSYNNNFYSQEGLASRWYQQAYVRYFVARWSYSTALHSLELANENHLTTPSYDAGFAVAQYVHSLSPRHILMSNSFWGWFVDPFWTDPHRGDLMDYADKHWYANQTGSGDYGELISAIWTDSAANVRQCWEWFNNYKTWFNYDKPIVRGETGVAVSGTQPQNPDIAKDTQGVYYHKKLWAHVGVLGYTCDGEWYPGVLDANHLWGMYAAYERFMQGEPVSNGQYEEIGTDLDGARQISITGDVQGLRAWGTRDVVHGKVLLWIDNANHTWKNVVDQAYIPPVSGTLTLQELPRGVYTAEWWNTVTGARTASTVYTVGDDHKLTFSISRLATDQAVKFARTNLAASKTSSSLSARHGQVVTYTLTIDGMSGPVTQTIPITVTDVLPVGIAHDGRMCSSSWGAPPACSSTGITWTGALSAAARLLISYTAQVTTTLSAALVNHMQVDAGSSGAYTSAVTILANPQTVYIPLILKGTGQ